MVLWSWITLCLRTFVAIVFIPYAIGKLQNPSNFADIIRRHRIIPNQFSNSLAWILPVVELGLGLFFLLNIFPFVTGIALGVLLILFSCILLRAHFSPRINMRNCGCSGVVSQESTTGIDLIRNALLLSSVLIVVIGVSIHNSLLLSPQPLIESVLLVGILVGTFYAQTQMFSLRTKKVKSEPTQNEGEIIPVSTLKRNRRSFIEWGIQLGIATFIGAGAFLNMTTSAFAAYVDPCDNGASCDCGPGGKGPWSGSSSCDEQVNCAGHEGQYVPIWNICIVYCCGSGAECEVYEYEIGTAYCDPNGC